MKSCTLALLMYLLVYGENKMVISSPKRYESSIVVNGMERTFLVNLPSNYNDTSKVALVLALHGGGGSAKLLEENSGMTAFAEKSGFVVLYPEGAKGYGLFGVRTWNAGNCCAPKSNVDIDDVKFISDLIDTLLIMHPKIISTKVFATGMSNGGMMCYRLACELSDKIAAIAVVEATNAFFGECNVERPVPLLHIHSIQDKKVPPDGGKGVLGKKFNPVMDGINHWVIKNGCILDEATSELYPEYSKTSWSNCIENASVEYILTNDGGHARPGGKKVKVVPDVPSQAIAANEEIWTFFQKH